MHVLLVGAGEMAKQYIKVLKELDVCFTVVGRNDERAKYLSDEMGVPVLTGGIENAYVSIPTAPTHVIIATTLESLTENTLFLLDKRIKNILVEKPGSVDLNGLDRIYQKAESIKSSVFIAYNRRFYASVLKVEELIKLDGGLTSFNFDFTEWTHVIESLNKTRFQLDNWFVGNSTHVLDLAFYLGGKPKMLSSFVEGELNWHNGSIFTGAGVTEKKVPFSYHANWEGPGRWALELITRYNKFIFSPLEKLQVQKKGSLNIECIDIEDKFDKEFKPGLYQQVKTFLFNESVSPRLLKIDEAIDRMEIYMKIKSGNR